MNAPVRQTPTPSDMLTPSKVADYIQRLETKLGRAVEKATIRPDGGIEVSLAGTHEPTNPADLVDPE